VCPLGGTRHITADGRAENTQYPTTRSDHPDLGTSPAPFPKQMGWSCLLLYPIPQLHAHVRKFRWQSLPARGACAATSGHQQLQASLVRAVPARQRDWIQQHLEAHGAATVVGDLRFAGALVPGAAGGRRVAIGVVSTWSWSRRWYARGSSRTAWEACRGLRHSSQEERRVYERVCRWCERATPAVRHRSTVRCKRSIWLRCVAQARTHTYHSVAPASTRASTASSWLLARGWGVRPVLLAS
jgi:hypothetical protein